MTAVDQAGRVGRQLGGSDACDSPTEMDHRDLAGCLCPSGVAALGVFLFR
jgi:hypothetical protein